MRVLNVAYPLTPVSINSAGGSEQILTRLDQALVQAGHQSLVIAAAGSQLQGELIEGPPAPPCLTPEVRERARRDHKRLIHQTLERFEVDLVHMHSLDFHHYLPERRVPVLATLHLPPDWYPEQIFRFQRPAFYLNCVSESEHATCPKSMRLLPCIPNGVAVDQFQWQSEKRSFVLALGRICPEKGFHFALQAAHAAGVELVLAGELFPYAEHKAYFRQQIEPLLDERRRFLGPVGFEQKRELLARARCLLIPSTVAETSSLVAMEAMASGTPVVAFRSGALPEIVEDGVTGFLVSDAQAMAEAIHKTNRLQPHDCRQAASKRFSDRVMADRYVSLYERIIKAEVRRAEMRQGAAVMKKNRKRRETADRQEAGAARNGNPESRNFLSPPLPASREDHTRLPGNGEPRFRGRRWSI